MIPRLFLDQLIKKKNDRFYCLNLDRIYLNLWYHFSHKIQRSFSCNPNSVIIITTERRRNLFAHVIFSLVYRWSNSAKSKQENERKEYTNRRWLAIYRSHCSLSPLNRCCATIARQLHDGVVDDVRIRVERRRKAFRGEAWFPRKCGWRSWRIKGDFRVFCRVPLDIKLISVRVVNFEERSSPFPFLLLVSPSGSSV